ncbi:MMPL family transporter [Streptomyces sp. NPDC003027]
MILLWLVLAVAAGPYTVRLGEVAQAGADVTLREHAESARVERLLNPTGAEVVMPLAVIWTSRPEGERVTARQQQAARQVIVRLTGTAGAPVLSRDGRALTAVITAEPDGGAARLAAVATAAASVAGTSVHLAGPAVAQADLDAAFSRIDGALLAVTLGGVLLILLLVHRSVITPLLVITGSLLALAVACAILYALARPGWLTISRPRPHPRPRSPLLVAHPPPG